MEPVESVARKIVKAGYKQLSLRNHPDTGGTHEAMVALNAARDFLDRLLQNGGRSGLEEFFGAFARSNPWHEPEELRRRAQREAAEAAQRARATQRAWAEDMARERQQQEKRRASMRITPAWTEVDGVVAANQSPRALCCQIPGFGKPFWIALTQIAPDSEIRKAGDRGTLRIKTAFARQAGIINRT